jgi:hypothetical protein
MSHSRSMSMRMVAAAGSLALAASAFAAPAVLAQDGSPIDTINALLEGIEAKELDSLSMYFCDEFADDMGGLDFASIADDMPPGMDAQALLDAFIFDVEIESAEVISETDTEAIVNLVGSMSMDINADAIGGFVEALLGSRGEEATPDMVEMFTGLVLSEFEGESTDISAEITLVPGETMAWLVCSDLTGDTADGAAATSSDATAGETES